MSRQGISDPGKPPSGGKGILTRETVGYCTFLLLKNPEEAERYAAQLAATGEDRRRVERKTRRKLAATKEYINQNRRELWVYLYHRELRREAMEASITREGLGEEAARTVRLAHFEKESQFLRVRRARTSLKEFTILARLGKGGYGQVYLARKVDTGEILALKQMKKSRFTDKNEVHRVKKEREVMTKINSVWLARLKYCFQSQHYLYMAMEYIPGGDLKTLLDHMTCLEEEDAKFLFAEMLLAVDALHQLGYIHRDLKPDNFMIDKNGHLKLIDFGLSKEGFNEKLTASRQAKARRMSLNRVNTWSKRDTPLVPQTAKTRNRQRRVFSVVGSPEYMALEILNQDGYYSNLVDYWSLGVILFEFLFGMTPFGADTVAGVFENVKNYESRVVKPPREDDDDGDEISNECWNLISLLLTSADKRLGKNGLADFKSHPWFSGFDWQGIRDIEPPFIPNLESENDTSYFPAEAPMIQSDLLELEADLDHMISKNIARSTEGNSMETVFDHRTGKSKEHKDLEGTDKKENKTSSPLESFGTSHSSASSISNSGTKSKRGSSRRTPANDSPTTSSPAVPPLLIGQLQAASSSTTSDAGEHPKLKFNQSYSKFDFAGFTFKHEDLSILSDAMFHDEPSNPPTARSRSNSTVELDTSAITHLNNAGSPAIEEVPLTIVTRDFRESKESKDSKPSSPRMPSLLPADDSPPNQEPTPLSKSKDSVSRENSKRSVGSSSGSSDRISNNDKSIVPAKPPTPTPVIPTTPSPGPSQAGSNETASSASSSSHSRSSSLVRRLDEVESTPKLGRTNTVVLNRPIAAHSLPELALAHTAPAATPPARRGDSDLDSLKRRLSRLKSGKGDNGDDDLASSSAPQFSESSSSGSRSSLVDSDPGVSRDNVVEGEKKKKRTGLTLRKGIQGALELFGLRSPRSDSSSHIVVSTKSSSSKVVSPRNSTTDGSPISTASSTATTQPVPTSSGNSSPHTRTRSGTAGNAEAAGLTSDIITNNNASSSSSSSSRSKSRHQSEGRQRPKRSRTEDVPTDSGPRRQGSSEISSPPPTSSSPAPGTSSPAPGFVQLEGEIVSRSHARERSTSRSKRASRDSRHDIEDPRPSKDLEGTKSKRSSRDSKHGDSESKSRRSSRGSRHSSRPTSRRNSQRDAGAGEAPDPAQQNEAKERILALARAREESQHRFQQQSGSGSGTYSGLSSGKSSPRTSSPSRTTREGDGGSSGASSEAASPAPGAGGSELSPQAVGVVRNQSDRRKRSNSGTTTKSKRMSHRLSSTDVKAAMTGQERAGEATSTPESASSTSSVQKKHSQSELSIKTLTHRISSTDVRETLLADRSVDDKPSPRSPTRSPNASRKRLAHRTSSTDVNADDESTPPSTHHHHHSKSSHSPPRGSPVKDLPKHSKSQRDIDRSSHGESAGSGYDEDQETPNPKKSSHSRDKSKSSKSDVTDSKLKR